MKLYQIYERGYGGLQIFFISEEKAKEYCVARDQEILDLEKADVESEFERDMERYRKALKEKELRDVGINAALAAVKARAAELGVESVRSLNEIFSLERITPRKPNKDDYPAFDPSSYKPTFSYIELETED
jgi:hypothetical protein